MLIQIHSRHPEVLSYSLIHQLWINYFSLDPRDRSLTKTIPIPIPIPITNIHHRAITNRILESEDENGDQCELSRTLPTSKNCRMANVSDFVPPHLLVNRTGFSPLPKQMISYFSI